MPEVYAQKFDLRPLDGLDPVEAFSKVIDRWARYKWANMPTLNFEVPMTLKNQNGTILRWEPCAAGDWRLIDFSWRHPDQNRPDISWATHVAFVQEPSRTRMSVRVTNTGPSRKSQDILMTTRPRLVHHLPQFFEVCGEWGQCSASTEPIASGQDVEFFVRYVLFDPVRRFPVLILTPQASGDFPVPPGHIGEEFLSLARIYHILHPRDTYVLTAELRGRRLSCFGGAGRVYMPGLRIDSDPYRHPLLLPPRLTDRSARHRLAQALALQTTLRFEEITELQWLRDERAVVEARRREELVEDLRARAMQAQEDSIWQELFDIAVQENEAYRESIESLTIERDELKSTLDAERRRARWLAHQLAAAGRLDTEEEMPPGLEPESVLEALQLAAAHYGDELLFLPTAFESAELSPYRDAGGVLRVLDGLANIARQLSAGGMGKPLYEAFRDLGIDYSPGISQTTPERLRQQYRFVHEGHMFVCEQHVRLGSSRDPAECLRVYFSSDVRSANNRIVVGHVGRHLEVITT